MDDDWLFSAEADEDSTTKASIDESKVIDALDRITSKAVANGYTTAQLEVGVVMKKLETELGTSLVSFRTLVASRLALVKVISPPRPSTSASNSKLSAAAAGAVADGGSASRSAPSSGGSGSAAAGAGSADNAGASKQAGKALFPAKDAGASSSSASSSTAVAKQDAAGAADDSDDGSEDSDVPIYQRIAMKHAREAAAKGGKAGKAEAREWVSSAALNDVTAPDGTSTGAGASSSSSSSGGAGGTTSTAAAKSIIKKRSTIIDISDDDDESVEEVDEDADDDDDAGAASKTATAAASSSSAAAAAGAAAASASQQPKGSVKLQSSLPLMLPKSNKKNRATMLVQIEDEKLDLSGDIGAIGRLTALPQEGVLLDLKGHQYVGTIVPCCSLMVVGFQPKEARVEAIVSDFVQVEHLSNMLDSLTGSLTSGVLDPALLQFDDIDEAGVDRLAKRNAGSDSDEEGADDDDGPRAAKKGSSKSKKRRSGDDSDDDDGDSDASDDDDDDEYEGGKRKKAKTTSSKAHDEKAAAGAKIKIYSRTVKVGKGKGAGKKKKKSKSKSKGKGAGKKAAEAKVKKVKS